MRGEDEKDFEEDDGEDEEVFVESSSVHADLRINDGIGTIDGRHDSRVIIHIGTLSQGLHGLPSYSLELSGLVFTCV